LSELTGEVVLITGASAPNGIGQAIARRLARAGARVAVTDVSGSMEINGEAVEKFELLERLADDIGREIALPLPLDVTDPASIAATISEIEARLGPVGILVNNAATIVGTGDFLATTPAQWEHSFRVNLLGPMMLSQAVISGMRRMGGGRIINIGSTGSLGAEAGFGAYTAMKHGLVGLTKTLAAEFGPDGILCNTVCPGFIDTDMHACANARLARESGKDVQDVKSERYAAVALRDAGRPEDVAAAVLFLAGSGGKYVTGINLPVSGGVPVGL